MKKKGVNQYIAWVMLIVLAVGIGTFMFGWTRKYTQEHVEYLETSTDDVLCESVNININGMCQIPQSLNINISNNNNLRVEKLLISYLDIYGNSGTKEIQIKLSPGDNQKIEVLKQGTLEYAKVTPIAIKDNKLVPCFKSSIALEQIKQC